MSKVQATSHMATAHADKKGCGCGGHDKRVQAEKAPAGARAQLDPSTQNKRAQVEQPASDSGCCGGGKHTG